MNFNIYPIEIQTKRKCLQKQDFKTLRGLLVLSCAFQKTMSTKSEGRAFVIECIELYKSLPAIWNVSA